MKIDWSNRNPEEGRAAIEVWLVNRPGISHARVSEWRTPRAGSSFETVFCQASWTEDGIAHDEEFIVRIQLSDYSLFPDADLFLQSRVMRALALHPQVPAPTVYWEEHGSDALGAPFFVMNKIEGEVPPDLISLRKGNFVDALGNAERTTLYEAGLAAMADLHAIDWQDGFTFLAGRGCGQPGLDEYLGWVEDWYAWAARGRHFALIEKGLRFLRDHQPRDPGTGIVWGDARAGNMLFGKDLRPTAVIDWEMAAVGPGEVDLGWWVMWETIWLPADDYPASEGFLTRDQMIAAYERRRGRPVRDFAYYELLAGVRFATMMVAGVDKRIEAGILPPTTTAGSNNVATRYVAALLGETVPELSPDLGQLAAEMGEA